MCCVAAECAQKKKKKKKKKNGEKRVILCAKVVTVRPTWRAQAFACKQSKERSAVCVVCV
jgi:hypothetical protein